MQSTLLTVGSGQTACIEPSPATVRIGCVRDEVRAKKCENTGTPIAVHHAGGRQGGMARGGVMPTTKWVRFSRPLTQLNPMHRFPPSSKSMHIIDTAIG